MSASICVLYITAPKGAKAEKLARILVENRVAACVNIVPSLSSFYWWNGKVVKDGESLLIVKTQRTKVPTLIRLVKKNHPYSVPEIIALPIIAGDKPYLEWVKKETIRS